MALQYSRPENRENDTRFDAIVLRGSDGASSELERLKNIQSLSEKPGNFIFGSKEQRL